MPGERMVIVEDAAELRPDHPHVVWLEARPANVEGAGKVTMRDLVRQALRMRPDRLVVGEVPRRRGRRAAGRAEHRPRGRCGTMHANSAADVPARLEALGVAAGLSREAVHSQLASALPSWSIWGATRVPPAVSEIGVPARGPDGLVTMAPAVDVRRATAWPGPGRAPTGSRRCSRTP